MRVAANSGVVADLDSLVGLRGEARKLSFLPRQASLSLLAGQRSSKLRGRGLDFEELRAYVAGDDVRSIDWRVTARAGKAYVRTYKEERDRPVLLLVDQRNSMFFGSRTKMKSVAAAELAALVAWSIVHQKDRVGALLFGQSRLWAFRPARSEAQVQRICEGLVQSTAALLEPIRAAGDQFLDALRAAVRLVGHDALVIVISDFRELSSEATELFTRLRLHNDLLLIWVTDPLEKRLPNAGRVSVSNGFDELLVPSDQPELRERFASEFLVERARFERFVAESNATGFELNNEADVSEQVHQALGRALVARRSP